MNTKKPDGNRADPRVGATKLGRRLYDLRTKAVRTMKLLSETEKGGRASIAEPRTGRELLQALRASGLVGMCRDRQDIGDSSEFARKLRERAQKRNQGGR